MSDTNRTIRSMKQPRYIATTDISIASADVSIAYAPGDFVARDVFPAALFDRLLASGGIAEAPKKKE